MTHPRAIPPALATPVEPRLPPIHSIHLHNGLELLVVERHRLPVIDVRLVVRGGAAYDEPALAGRAYLTAELLDEGTTTRTATQIADEVEYLGAILHARATWDYTLVGLHVLASRIEPALELLADVVRRPAFPNAEVSRKRTERLAAILQELDEPRILASNAFARAVYGDAHPFGSSVAGHRASVERLEADDLRGFYHRYVRPENTFIVIAGDIRLDQAHDTIQRLFADWSVDSGLDYEPITVGDPSQHGASQAAVEMRFARAAQSGRHRRDKVAQQRMIRIVDRPGAPQSELRVGLAGPPRATTDFFPLLVGNVVLGGAFTSRLNMRLREEKAYTYGAGSQFAFRAHGGPFVASTAVFTGATADAVQVIIHEIERLGREPVTAAELERAQNYLVLGLPRTFETTGDIAEHVSEIVLYDLGRDFYDMYGARIRAVTAEQVMRAAAQWLTPEQLTVTIVGDAAAIEAELTSLGLGTVEVSNGI